MELNQRPLRDLLKPASLEKTLMLGKPEGRRRRGPQGSTPGNKVEEAWNRALLAWEPSWRF